MIDPRWLLKLEVLGSRGWMALPGALLVLGALICGGIARADDTPARATIAYTPCTTFIILPDAQPSPSPPSVHATVAAELTNPTVQGEVADPAICQWTVVAGSVRLTDGTNGLFPPAGTSPAPGTPVTAGTIPDSNYNSDAETTPPNANQILATPNANQTDVRFGMNITGHAQAKVQLCVKWNMRYTSGPHAGQIAQTITYPACGDCTTPTQIVDFYAFQAYLYLAPNVLAANAQGGFPICFEIFGACQPGTASNQGFPGARITAVKAHIEFSNGHSPLVINLVPPSGLTTPDGLLINNQVSQRLSMDAGFNVNDPKGTGPNGQGNIYTIVLPAAQLNGITFNNLSTYSRDGAADVWLEIGAEVTMPGSATGSITTVATNSNLLPTGKAPLVVMDNFIQLMELGTSYTPLGISGDRPGAFSGIHVLSHQVPVLNIGTDGSMPLDDCQPYASLAADAAAVAGPPYWVAGTGASSPTFNIASAAWPIDLYKNPLVEVQGGSYPIVYSPANYCTFTPISGSLSNGFAVQSQWMNDSEDDLSSWKHIVSDREQGVLLVTYYGFKKVVDKNGNLVQVVDVCQNSLQMDAHAFAGSSVWLKVFVNWNTANALALRSGLDYSAGGFAAGAGVLGIVAIATGPAGWAAYGVVELGTASGLAAIMSEAINPDTTQWNQARAEQGGGLSITDGSGNQVGDFIQPVADYSNTYIQGPGNPASVENNTTNGLAAFTLNGDIHVSAQTDALATWKIYSTTTATASGRQYNGIWGAPSADAEVRWTSTSTAASTSYSFSPTAAFSSPIGSASGGGGTTSQPLH